MYGRCPRCGAPMEGKKCEYCNYVEEEKKEKKEDDSKVYANNVSFNNIYIDQSSNSFNGNFKEIKSNKNRLITLLICIFLGIYGGHNFYVGNIGKGLLYLFTGGLFMFGWIVDIISIIRGNFEDANGIKI